tara:strand:- start:306 stop:467 length:162 start_codon:yes stop_codon:yes gene_type:complete
VLWECIRVIEYSFVTSRGEKLDDFSLTKKPPQKKFERKMNLTTDDCFDSPREL